MGKKVADLPVHDVPVSVDVWMDGTALAPKVLTARVEADVAFFTASMKRVLATCAFNGAMRVVDDFTLDQQVELYNALVERLVGK